jgi:cytochrome c
MRFIVFSMVLVSSLLVMNGVMADDMPPMAHKHDCNACHAVGKHALGPSWRDVAKKYKGDPNAEAYLIRKVSIGGGGIWGSIPMPANDPSGRKRADITELVKFILSLEK